MKRKFSFIGVFVSRVFDLCKERRSNMSRVKPIVRQLSRRAVNSARSVTILCRGQPPKIRNALRRKDHMKPLEHLSRRKGMGALAIAATLATTTSALAGPYFVPPAPPADFKYPSISGLVKDIGSAL